MLIEVSDDQRVSVCGPAVGRWHVDDGEVVVSTEYVHALTGATVELRCAVAAGRGDAVRWQRDDVDLSPERDDRFQLRSDDALDIVDVRLDDAGQYTCHVLDAADHHVRSQRFVVQVIGTTNHVTRTFNSVLHVA